jgi:hypothetical protein
MDAFGSKILMPQGLKKENINLFNHYCKKIILLKTDCIFRQLFIISGTYLGGPTKEAERQ